MTTEIFVNGRFLTQKVTGVQRNAYELTKRLIPAIANLIILVPNQAIDANYDLQNWPLRRVGRFKDVLWEQFSLPRYLSKSNNAPLLINLTNTAPLLYSNQIVSIMDMTTFVNPKWFSKKFAFYYQWLVPKIAKKAKVIFTISTNSKNDIIKFTKVRDDKIKVLYCGISEIFTSKVAEESSILLRLRLKQKTYFLAVSSLDPRKNFNRLIEAFLSAKTELPLVIVGSKGKVFNDAKISMAHLNSGRIVFTGYVNDVDLKSLYTSALCFIYPSLYEGFGIPPLEAMANGCPTIVSNSSSLPEVCGSASLYVDPYDQQSITAAIESMVDDENLKSFLIAEGYKNVKRFDWTISATRVLEEIKKINE